MKIGVQWTLASPGDWTWYDIRPGQAARLWERAAKKAKPTPGTVVTPDSGLGWPMAANVQGVVFEGMDCYAVTLDATGTGLVVTAWTEDYPGANLAQEWTFLPPAPDPALGGQVNTRQVLRQWSDSPLGLVPGALGWSQFVRPSEALIRYGVYVSDALLAVHQQVRSQRDWREWVA